MSSLIDHVRSKAFRLNQPLNAHLDLTWRCNEDCVHCYLDHSGRRELDTAEVKDLLCQLADAGTLFLVISGGEPFLRADLIEILHYARSLLFHVTLKTNGLLLGRTEADALARLTLAQVHVSIYSHRPDVHDAITRVPGSFANSVAAIRRLVSAGVRTGITDVIMTRNLGDYRGVHALAGQIGAECRIDPSVTPALHGHNIPVSLRVSEADLADIFRDPTVVGNVKDFCTPVSASQAEMLDYCLCGAGHNACYVSPAGDVMPCVQLPIICGNVTRQSFMEIWRGSGKLGRIRAIRTRDLPVCSACAAAAVCSRCPGLAYMSGDLFGPSPLDCETVSARYGIRGAALPT